MCHSQETSIWTYLLYAVGLLCLALACIWVMCNCFVKALLAQSLKQALESEDSIYDGGLEADTADNPSASLSLREFLATLGIEEHADAMEAEGVSSLDGLKLLTEESQLEALGQPHNLRTIVF